MTTTTTTARDVRQALFAIQDQQLTVAELRQKLFELLDQEQPIGEAIANINAGRIATPQSRKIEVDEV